MSIHTFSIATITNGRRYISIRLLIDSIDSFIDGQHIYDEIQNQCDKGVSSPLDLEEKVINTIRRITPNREIKIASGFKENDPDIFSKIHFLKNGLFTINGNIYSKIEKRIFEIRVTVK